LKESEIIKKMPADLEAIETCLRTTSVKWGSLHWGMASGLITVGIMAITRDTVMKNVPPIFKAVLLVTVTGIVGVYGREYEFKKVR